MKIAISVESTVDLTKELVEKYDLKVVPFDVLLGDKNYLDGEITSEEIIRYVNEHKVLPKTGAVNRARFEEHFEKILKDYDGIVHISLSSEMSSAFNNADAVKDKYKNVRVVDSRSLSTGIALLAIYAKTLADRGESLDSIYEKVQDRTKYVQASFELMRLDYLYKGGRCSSLMYFGANLLKIRPQILVKNGKMISGRKYRGNFSNVVTKYCDDILEEFDNPDLSVAFVTYTTMDDEVVNIAIEKLKDRGFDKIFVTHAGGTITSHCGENCLGILYINDGGNK